jgi:hypothetical protein
VKNMNKIFTITAILTAAIFASGVLASPTGYATVICTQPSDCPTGQTCVGSACTPISCGISAPGDWIHFNNAVQGTGWIHSEDTTLVTNTGNVPVTPTISGANWVGSTYPGNGNAWMDVGRTAWTVTDWGSIVSLSGTPASIGALTNTGDHTTVYYALNVPAQQPTDTYQQTITFTAGC